MTALKILFGIGLLTVALGDGVGICLSSAVAFKAMIVDGTPVICPIRGSEVRVPGRLAVGLVFGVPIAAFLAGWWLLREADESGTGTSCRSPDDSSSRSVDYRD